MHGLSLAYRIDRSRLSRELAEVVRELPPDDEALAFIEAWRARPHGTLASLALSTLARFVSEYDAHATLGMYPMHLLSTAQWRALVGTGERLLDVGAGAGFVTARAEPLFRTIVTTETSQPMARRLRARGYRCYARDIAETPLDEEAPFDVVSLLDVLDRCAAPRTLLAAATRALAPSGRLMVAVPLPLRPHVHVAGGTVDPEELLLPSSLDGEKLSWERAASALAEHVLAPLGLVATTISRVPYLSRGDARASVYALDDVVIVARREA
jgi:SAM-dependent methyltransferase